MAKMHDCWNAPPRREEMDRRASRSGIPRRNRREPLVADGEGTSSPSDRERSLQGGVEVRIREPGWIERAAMRSCVMAVLMGSGLMVAAPAAAEPVEEAIAAARALAERGQCDEAGARLMEIDGLVSRARLMVGGCLIGAGLYPEALESLSTIRGDRAGLTADQVGDVELYRAIALSHLERFAEASAALKAAEGQTREKAQLALYRGLIALRDGDNVRAAPALESAARLDPRQTEPVASYYAGMAWLGAAQRGKAREAFRRVVNRDGDGAWGQQAQIMLESTELFPWFVRGSVGMEWDDNVLLRGDVTQIIDGNPLTIAGKDDWRGVWEIEGGVQLFETEEAIWSGGVTASYTGNAHVDLGDVNTHYPMIGTYLSRRLGRETFAQARYAYGHAWVDEDSYIHTHTGELSLVHTWRESGTTLALVEVLANDLRFRPDSVRDGVGPNGTNPPCPPPFDGLSCSPPGVDERNDRDRDGVGYGFAIDHRYLVPVANALDEVLEGVELGGGYRFRYYDSEGSEWEHFAHALTALVEFDFPLGFGLGGYLHYEHRDFANPSTFPDVERPNFQYTLATDDREEDEVHVVGELTKELSDIFSVSARYSYLNNDSNRDAYNYDRHIVGGYLNFRFD